MILYKRIECEECDMNAKSGTLLIEISVSDVKKKLILTFTGVNLNKNFL